ncbi:hypothetical protein FRC11_014593, partial [Ceratobasidium sp. 423]
HQNKHTMPPSVQNNDVRQHTTNYAIPKLLDSQPVNSDIIDESMDGIHVQTPDEDSPVQLGATVNGHNWFDQSQYDRIIEGNTVRYVHHTAGCILGKKMSSWETLLKLRQESNPNSPWAPFKSEAQWKLGYWLVTCKSSQSKVNELLDMDG